MKIGNVEFGPYPVFLAPMEDVTDIGFRLLCKRFGAAMVYSEFVAADALVRMVNRSLEKLAVCDDERPVAIQIYGKEPGPVADAARIVVERARPDVLDLNFGCPVKRVAGKGAGAGMLQNIPKMLEITRAVVDAVDIPVTVKTRLGWDESSKVIVDLAERLQDCGIRALTIQRPYPGADVHRRSGLDAHRRGEKQSAHDNSHHRKRRHHFARTCP